jgi:demethylmenaquinone methyltransferase/2-methoxy-6-polyprenyl-1,4-benzoquinol methylase
MGKRDQPSREHAYRMFNRISRRYDMLNHILSLGRDVAWRKRIAHWLPQGQNLRLLDLATGTADVPLMLSQTTDQIGSVVGMDRAAQMLDIARHKAEVQTVSVPLRLVHADGQFIPAADESFDVVTVAFGIRNLVNPLRGLEEMHRVLRPGGRVLILEFSIPRFTPLRKLYLCYFRNALPRIGGWLSGDFEAYQYLDRTVETFPYGREFCDLMGQAGFVNINFEALTMGIASIYRGDK